MTEFKRAQAMHQYYRDAFIKTYFFDELGKTPKETLISLVDTQSSDPISCAETLFNLQTGLPADKDLALKQMILLISQSHLAMDKNRQGIQTPMSEAYKKSIRDGLKRMLKKVPSVNYLINAIQVLYRIGDLDEAMALVEKNEKIVDASPHLQQIVAMVYTIEQRYEEAMPYLIKLVESGEHQKNSLIKLMSMSCMYNLGAMPDEPVDFATLTSSAKALVSGFSYDWVIEPSKSQRIKPTLLIACDEKYFYEHALALIYSVVEHNHADVLVHLHLYTPNASVVQSVRDLAQQFPQLEISASSEFIDLKSPNKVVEFATRRFAVCRELLAHLNAPLILLDADALWRKPWKAALGEVASEHDVLVCQPEVAPFWESVAAGMLYLNNTSAAQHYIGQVVDFIEDNLKKGKMVWFLDQIALSACYHEAQKNESGIRFAGIASRLLIDVNHGEDSLTWVVTNQKNSAGAYADYKRELQQRHGQLAYSSINDAFTHISEQKKPVHFLQVGAMDGMSYDPIHPFIRQYAWQGVLVEPLPDMLERTRKNYEGCKGLSFENVAITEQIETKDLYRVKPETIQKHKLPDWLKGMSTFTENKFNEYQRYVTVEKVKCMPLMSLIERNALPQIDVFQIDTEGYDYKVYRQLDFSKFKPTIINLEVVNLSADEIKLLEADLFENGYVFYRYELDMIAMQRDWFFSARS